jgi:fructose transport system permease protein
MVETRTQPSQEFEKVLDKSATGVASFDRHKKTPLERLQHALHSNPALVPLIVLLLSVAIFGAILGTRFFSPFSLTLILQQVAIVGIVGAAQTMIIMTAGIDLSVGAIMVLSSVVMGQFTFRYGIPAPISILCGFAVGAIVGYINGFLVARIKLPPFIVTLGMWQIVLATNFLYSKNETIRAQDIEATAPLLQLFGHQVRLGGAVLTYGVIVMVLLVLTLSYILKHTAWGRHVYAIGDDPAAAELAGIQVQKTLISVYVIGGLICSLAGWVLIGRIGSVSPTAGQFANIESITAVVIGGISLFGGRGSILGMLFGALIVGVFGLGLRLIGTDPQWTYLLIGVLIIAAVAIDQWIRKVSG